MLSKQRYHLEARRAASISSQARRRTARVTPSATADGAEPRVYGDWREFRARLIAGNSGVNWSTRLCHDNVQLLQAQNPALAAEGTWAHATPTPEAGGLLLATPAAPRVLGAPSWWQAVVLLVQHGEAGSVGLILNRPSSLRMGLGRGGLPFAVIGAPTGMQTVFASNRVYCGGFVRQEVFHLLHGHCLNGALEVAPGLHVGGEAAAVAACREGRLSPDDFRFFSGACVWEPGQLEQEIERGAWYTVAAARSLVLKQCLHLPTPLWKEVLTAMGDEYAVVATAAPEERC